MVLRTAAVVFATALTYAALFELNHFLFSSFSFSKGVDWIYLPSGLRLVFILVFGAWGALGIALSSAAISLDYYFIGDHQAALMTGLISGLSPLLARRLCVACARITVELEQLTGRDLLTIATVFAVISPLMHQLWFVANGQTENFLTSTAVMALGDLIGTVLVLYAATQVRHTFAKIPDFPPRPANEFNHLGEFSIQK